MTVSIPAAMSVNEGDGIVQVCITMLGITERDFMISLSTSDGTGI